MGRTEPPALSRSLFGYRRRAVDQIILDREIMLRQSDAKIQAAESRAAELEDEIAKLREQNEAHLDAIGQLRNELEDVRARLAEVPPPPPPPDLSRQITSEFLADELTRVLSSAEETAKRIVERARHSTEQQIEEADRVWREAQAQIGRFATWRDRVEPAVRSAQARIDDVRQRIEDVPAQIRAALAPLADAVGGLDVDLAQVTAVSTPPLLVAPGGLDRRTHAGPEPPARPAPSEAEPGSSAAGEHDDPQHRAG
jgi:DNA repair exonuclease SbcCD ATPase subunit